MFKRHTLVAAGLLTASLLASAACLTPEQTARLAAQLAESQCLAAVTEGPPEYRLLTGLEAWFMPPAVPTRKPPVRWRMAVITWLGIFPTVALLQWLIYPLLAGLPFLPRIAVFTALVVLIMTWGLMPRLTRWPRPWLAH